MFRNLLDDRPHAIRIVLDKPRKLAGALSQIDEVLALKMVGKRTLVVESSSPERIYDLISELALANDLGVREIGAEDESLEAVFQYLTG